MISIAITGPESTGKSALAQALSCHYGVSWVNEFAREYLDENGPKYSEEDLEIIATNQHRNIERAKESDGELLIADTEMLVMKVWSDVVFGSCSDSIMDLLDAQDFDLFLLCDIDLPWAPDPLREHPGRREEILQRYVKELEDRKLSYCVVRGLGKDRIKAAISCIESQLMLNPNSH